MQNVAGNLTSVIAFFSKAEIIQNKKAPASHPRHTFNPLQLHKDDAKYPYFICKCYIGLTVQADTDGHGF